MSLYAVQRLRGEPEWLQDNRGAVLGVMKRGPVSADYSFTDMRERRVTAVVGQADGGRKFGTEAEFPR
jgi:hypothetical protein